MTVGFLYHDDCSGHEPGPGHPEQSSRAAHVRSYLDQCGQLAELDERTPPEATPLALGRVHTQTYLDRVDELCGAAPSYLDSGDTPLSTGSQRAARLAAGGVIDAVDAVLAGDWKRAFCCLRPPGHHAERATGMGFCLYNNVAVAAAHLLSKDAMERVAIVDWDVHHGNGTQDAFHSDPRVFYASLHQWPLYPGTGAAGERGTGAGEGTTLNCPLPKNAGDREWLTAFEGAVLPALESFAPHFVLISAGFDAHADDPLAQTRLTESAYARMTEGLIQVAGPTAGGRVVSTLEGGYDLDALARSVSVHLEAMGS